MTIKWLIAQFIVFLIYLDVELSSQDQQFSPYALRHKNNTE